MQRWALRAASLVLAGCFHPVYDRPACSGSGECPGGLVCNKTTNVCEGPGGPIADAAMSDGPVAPDGFVDPRPGCLGSGLLGTLCLSSVPTLDVTLSQPINTDASDGTCTQVFTQAGGPDLCVIAGHAVTVQGTVTATGKRALVLFAVESLVVMSGAALDVSSTTAPTRAGAGANPGACSKSGSGASSTSGAGGGAGGSLATKGGNGGDGNLNGTPATIARGGTAGAPQPAPTVLRGGCPGGDGGGGQGNNGGAGGSGGGAVYLIAGSSITITGDVFASGAGGDALNNNAGQEQGGGGGGSGGMVGLDAPTVAIDGRITANGAAGAGGGGTTGGKPGGDGTTTSWNARAAAGGPGTICGTPAENLRIGSGAPGTALNSISNLDGGPGDCGAGGGGGGLGIVTIYGYLSGGTTISPAPTLH